MEWLAELARASRVSYNHPLRLQLPLEVLTLRLQPPTPSPELLRDAVETLSVLHSTGPRDLFRAAMNELSQWRESYLSAKDLSRDVFPVISVEIDSVVTLQAAELFFLSCSTRSSRKNHLELALRVEIQYDGEHFEYEYEFLERIANILECLRAPSSPFQLTVVELELSNCALAGDAAIDMVTRVFRLALHEIQPTPAHKVSFGLAASYSDAGSFLAWGRLFQTLCRVGGEDSSGSGNVLAVSVAQRCDARVLAAFWSAVAFSRGYSHLQVNEQQLGDLDSNVDVIKSKYMAVALLSRATNLIRFNWVKSEIRACVMDAIELLQPAAMASIGDLSQVLWQPELSCAHGASAVEPTAFDEKIAVQYGWILHDSHDSDSIDVFVPGFGQCSVNRNEWQRAAVGAVVSSNLLGEPRLVHLNVEIKRENEASSLELARLFPVIGASLQFIRIDAPRSPVNPVVLVSICEFCPVLKELFVSHVELATESVFIDPTRIASCAIIKLQLGFVNSSNQRPPIGDHTQDFLASLMPLVGTKMEYLDIRKEPGIIPFARAFEVIVSSCVSLFHLKLGSLDVATLDPLIGSYRRGTSRISSLYLFQCPVDSARLARFAGFLSDQSTASSTKLGVLHINQFSSEPGDAVQLHGLDAFSIQAILDMLQRNRTLTELYLAVPDTGVGRIVVVPLRPFKRRFEVYNDEQLPLSSESYPIESTVAFVDALQRRQLPFNQEILRVVTQFAAQRILRSVRYDVINSNVDGFNF